MLWGNFRMHISVFQNNNSMVPNGERESSGRTQIQTSKIIGSVRNFEKWIKMKNKKGLGYILRNCPFYVAAGEYTSQVSCATL